MTPDEIADLVARDGYQLRGAIWRAENVRVVPEQAPKPAPNLARGHGPLRRSFAPVVPLEPPKRPGPPLTPGTAAKRRAAHRLACTTYNRRKARQRAAERMRAAGYSPAEILAATRDPSGPRRGGQTAMRQMYAAGLDKPLPW